MARAQVRELVQFVASVVQPFLFARRVRPHLEAAVDLESGDARLVGFIRDQLERNMQTLNELLERVPGPFAFGDSPSMADCVVVPQAVGAARMGIDVSQWHRISSVVEACHRLPEFAAAHPMAQADAPSSNPTASAPGPVAVNGTD
jgi:glutathione S-transferase